MLLAATNDDDRARPASTASRLPARRAPEKIVMLDKAFGAVDKGRRTPTRVVFTLSRFEEFPDLWVSDTSFRDMKKVSNANPQQAELRLGQGGDHRVHQRGRQEAARDPDQAGELRSGEEVSADGLHLRGAVEGLHSYARAERRHEHQRHALRQQRLRRAAARHRLRDRLPGRERREVRHPRGQHRRRAGLHRSEAHRHPGTLVGRLPDHVPDHADQHVRGGARPARRCRT